MPRTTADKVEGIVQVEEDDDLDPFIESANMLIEALCVPAGYSEVELEILERWLSAHFYQVDRSKAESETMGRAMEKIVSRVDLGLDLTHPGQQVKVLDYKGALASLSQPRKKVRVIWLGKTPQERRLSVWQRMTDWGWWL